MCASTAHGWNTSHHFAPPERRLKPQNIIMASAITSFARKGKHHSEIIYNFPACYDMRQKYLPIRDFLFFRQVFSFTFLCPRVFIFSLLFSIFTHTHHFPVMKNCLINPDRFGAVRAIFIRSFLRRGRDPLPQERLPRPHRSFRYRAKAFPADPPTAAAHGKDPLPRRRSHSRGCYSR